MIPRLRARLALWWAAFHERHAPLYTACTRCPRVLRDGFVLTVPIRAGNGQWIGQPICVHCLKLRTVYPVGHKGAGRGRGVAVKPPVKP